MPAAAALGDQQAQLLVVADRTGCTPTALGHLPEREIGVLRAFGHGLATLTDVRTSVNHRVCGHLSGTLSRMPTTAANSEAPTPLITGVAVRVGKVIAQTLVSAGYRVWIHYNRSSSEAEELCRSLGAKCLGTLAAQLADQTAREALCARVQDPSGPAAGRLDLLVNSAASFESGRFEARTDADLRRVLEVNLVAPISFARAFAPALRRTQGAIVNILDLAAYHPWNNYLDHCTAKAGLWMATRALASELAPNVRVNGIAPGTVLWPDSPQFAPGSQARARIVDRIPLARIGAPEDVADTVLFLARSTFITGQAIAIDGGRMVRSPQEYL